ncbi:MAG: glycosyltransferase family 39 protein [Candidatus Omnitrophica bacterium]|nr:glycosyltransferase family 39 protein [Candidatus Omnitrophota bacterium]
MKIARTLGALAWAAGLCAVAMADVFVWGGGYVRAPIALGGGEGFPVPLFLWSAAAVYAWGYARATGEPVARQWGRALGVAFGLHVVFLMTDLVAKMAEGRYPLASVWYQRYVEAVWGALLGGGLAALAWVVLRHPLRSDGQGGRLWLAPLALGYAVFWGQSLLLAPVPTLAVSVIGLGAAAAWRMDRVGRWIGRQAGAWWTSERLFVGFIALLALGIRVFYATRVMSNPDFLNTGSDGPVYDDIAWSIVQGVPSKWDYIPMLVPGYTRFLAMLYWLFGRNYFLVCAVQSVVGAAACVLMYAIARRLGGRAVARLAMVFGALDFPMVFAAAAIGHQAMDLFWTLLVVWCLLRYLEAPRRLGGWLLGVGALLGWAILTRETNLPFWIILAGWFLLGVRTVIGLRLAAGHFLALSIGVLLVYLPVSRNQMHRQIGEGSLRGHVAWLWFKNAPTDLHETFNPWSDPQGAFRALREQPVVVAGKLAAALWSNFQSLFFSQTYGRFDPIFLVRDSVFFFGMWSYAYLLVLLGLMLVIQRGIRQPTEHLGWWLIVVLLASRTLAHLFFESSYRHRTPFDPYLIILASFACIWVLRTARQAVPSASCPAT